MTRFPIALAAAALLCGTAATAQTKPAPKPTAKAAVAAKTTAKTTVAANATSPAKPAPAAVAKPAPAATTKPAPRAKAALASTGRMVTTKTTTGKTITYNCSLAGNKTKKACQ